MTILEATINIFAPHSCLGCGDEGNLLCTWCLPEAFGTVPSRCYKCYTLTPGSKVCQRCHRNISLNHVWVTTEYGGLAKRLTHLFKFERVQAAAPLVASSIYKKLPYLPQALIVPIPTTTSRRRQRGYDHTKLIAKELARLTHLRKVAALARLDQTRQVGSKRAERREQLVGAFRVKHQRVIQGQRILLVDDIVTTGATLEEAARVLKSAGAKSVDAAVFAQSQ